MQLDTGDSLSDDVEMREEMENETEEAFNSNGKARAVYDMSTKIEKCEITCFHKTEKTVGNFTTYEITVILDNNGEKDTFTINRRYSHFNWLHKSLCQIPGIMLPPFPEKDYFNQFTESIIQYRKVVLHNYLNGVARKEPSLTYTYLIPFLSCNAEEMDLHIKDSPIIKEYLPAKTPAVSFFSWLKVTIPSLKLTALRRFLAQVSVPEDIPKLDEEEMERCAISADTYGKELGLFASCLSDMLDKTDSLWEKIDDFSRRLDNINTDGEADSYSASTANSDSDKNSKLFRDAMAMLQKLGNNHIDFFTSLKIEGEKLHGGVENYAHEFSELVRLNRQYKKYLSNISGANMLISEYKSKLLGEKELDKKKKYEEFIRQLKEFKELMNKSIKIFRVNFSIAYRQFQATRLSSFESVVESYLDGVKGVFSKAEEKFGMVLEGCPE